MSQIEEISRRLQHFSRFPLAHYPTALEPLPRLSKALRRPVYIKRDDTIGPFLGGNKTRKLEYLIADAKRQGAQRIVTYGGLQSNHARMTAAAALMAGIEPHVFYFEKRPAQFTGNLLLLQKLGARLYFLPIGGTSTAAGMTMERTNRLVQLVARIMIGKHYFIPVGGHHWLGCMGYVWCMLELEQQLQDAGHQQAQLFCAAGTGGTQAGLLAGAAMLHSVIQPVGIDIGRLWKDFGNTITNVARQITIQLGLFQPITNASLIENRYTGVGYAIADPFAEKAIARLAYLEGILLDPVYTGKAFAGMLDLAESGALGRNTPLIFLHTGGSPAIFA